MLNKLSRRNMLKLLSAAGGGAFTRALGWTAPSTYAGPLRLRGQGAGKRVLILGAGIAGLAAAYELGKLGYACTLLEARDRVGGRCWTVRRGDVATEAGSPAQTCNFDSGQFFDAGPDRIPQHHRAVLAYCREFGISMRAFITFNGAGYHFRENIGPLSGRKTRLSEVFANLQGYTSELLIQAIQAGVLDAQLPEPDKKRMFEFLASYGNLSGEHVFEDAAWGGYSVPNGAFLQKGEPLKPLALNALLQAEYWHGLPFEWDLNQQLALLHPTDGMDAIAQAFAQRLMGQITLRAEVREIRRTTDGVQITFVNSVSNQASQATADFCICTLPLPVLASVTSNFSAETKRAIGSVPYTAGTTMGLQFARRFWEDEDFIYGGGSFTNLSIGEIWYPSRHFHAPKGVLRGVHAFGEAARAIGDLPPASRVDEAVRQGAKIHGSYRAAFEQAFSVAWHKTPYSLGAWAEWPSDLRATAYQTLLDLDDRLYLAGDHMSYLSGWLEGAVLSAQDVVRRIHERALRS